MMTSTDLDLARRLEREEQIFQLRNAGWTLREIGRDQGISPARVTQIIERRTQRTIYPHVDEMRSTMGKEIRDLLDVYIAEAKEGHHAAAHVVAKLWERQAKLFGLDAPSRHEIDSTDRPWENVYEAVLVEAEVIDDDERG